MQWCICSYQHNHMHFTIFYSTYQTECFIASTVQWCVLCVQQLWQNLVCCNQTKNSEHTTWRVSDFGSGSTSVFFGALQYSIEIPTIETDIFVTYYSDWIWCEKLATTLLAYARQHKTYLNYLQGLSASQNRRELPVLCYHKIMAIPPYHFWC